MHPIQRRPTIRIATGLLIALAALIPAALSTSAQENGLASITIYSSLCPPDYQEENYYDDCYDTPAGEGIVFTLTNLEDPSDTFTGTSGPSGFAAIEGIDHDGFFQLSFDVPFAISSAPGNCSEDGNPFEVGSEYQMNLTTDNDIRCDIFISPAGDNNPDPPTGDGSVTIYLTSCPVGYGGSDVYADCYDNPVADVTFSATPQTEGLPVFETGQGPTATTNANGVAVLELAETEFGWGIANDIPGDFLDFHFISCTLGGQQYEINQMYARGILLDVPAGADIRCDWFIVPTDSQGDTGTLTIYNTACPAGYTGTNYYPDCYNNPRSGIAFAASAIKLNFTTQGVTDANGIVSLPLPVDNTIGSPITLSQNPTIEVPKGSSTPPFFVYCTSNGVRVDVTYNLVQRDPAPTDIFTASISPEPGEDVRCDWYDLPKGQSPAPSPAPSPSPSAPPVTQLPNTGAGATSDGLSTDLMIGIALLGVAGSAGAYALSRQLSRHAA